ncbi:MAG: GAF domain-containing sensor histidine kinase [Pseudomonadota bacterium]|nr:GAF domain-containing sensor histidine kinase [Pseudomonadota bacterium]
MEYPDLRNFSEIASDSQEEIERDMNAVRRIEALPTLLAVLCEMTGMRFAAVARVTENTWTACAIKDEIEFGIKVGGQLPVESTLCVQSKRQLTPIVVDQASLDPLYHNHHALSAYRFESYVTVPIVLASGRYFGNLCTIDPAPAKVNVPKIVGMFVRFAKLIAIQLEQVTIREREQDALRHERATSELREQFIAILGHDLRNPLQAISSTSELIARKWSDPSLLSLVARIKANSKRMSALIDDVLDFARGRLGGGIGIEVEDVYDVDSALQAVVQELRDGHPTRQIIADIDVCCTVRCDIGRVQQVVSNLIANALTHGALHSPVKVKAVTDESHLICEVWNIGEPIPPESIGKVFEPFWRHNTSVNRQGLGLGLHICSQIVGAHHGSLDVISTREAGTRFTARFPLREHSEIVD